MREKTCCFTGHRRIDKTVRDALAVRVEEVVRELIAQGIVYFGAGGAVGFDTLAAQTVLRLKREYPHIRLVLVLPCENQADGWSRADREVYEGVRCAADKVVYTSKAYTEDCMLRRNRHLVDHSCVCVSYMTHYGGGTGYTVGYARKRGVRVINLE